MGDAASLQLLLMMLRALVARGALQGGVETAAAVVHGPDRELVWDWTCLYR
jgi:hypothetical protein